MNIQSAIARLERAGDESSKFTQKLREAAATLSTFIANKFEYSTPIASKTGDFQVFVSASNIRQVEVRLAFEDDHSFVGADVENAMQFARAVKNGLLEDIAVQLEKISAEKAQNVDVLTVDY